MHTREDGGTIQQTGSLSASVMFLLMWKAEDLETLVWKMQSPQVAYCKDGAWEKRCWLHVQVQQDAIKAQCSPPMSLIRYFWQMIIKSWLRGTTVWLLQMGHLDSSNHVQAMLWSHLQPTPVLRGRATGGARRLSSAHRPTLHCVHRLPRPVCPDFDLRASWKPSAVTRVLVRPHCLGMQVSSVLPLEIGWRGGTRSRRVGWHARASQRCFSITSFFWGLARSDE